MKHKMGIIILEKIAPQSYTVRLRTKKHYDRVFSAKVWFD